MSCQYFFVNNIVQWLKGFQFFHHFFILLMVFKGAIYRINEYSVFDQLILDFLEFVEGGDNFLSFFGIQVELNEDNPKEQKLLLLLLILHQQIMIGHHCFPCLTVTCAFSFCFSFVQLDLIVWGIFSLGLIDHILVL